MSSIAPFSIQENNTKKNGEVKKKQNSAPIANAGEFRAWYLYEAANGAFFYTASVFLPVLITTQAQVYAPQYYCQKQASFMTCMNTGGFYSDHMNQGKCSKAGFGNATACASQGGTWSAKFRPEAQVVNFFGADIFYGSFAPYCNSVAVGVQLLLYFLMGSFADHGPLRKSMFIFFNTVGVASCILPYFLDKPDHFALNGAMWIIGIASFSFCVVFYNAYLTVLCVSHYKVHEARDNGASDDEQEKLIKELTHKESIKGYGTGFCLQMVFQVLTIFGTLQWVAREGLKLTDIRTVIATSGVWLFLLSTVTFLKVKKRPGPPLPKGASYVGLSLKQAYSTLLSFKELPELGKYLGAFFVYSDGIQTIAATSAMFATIEIGLTTKDLTLAMIIVSFCSLISVILWKWILSRGVRPKTILLLNIMGLSLVPTIAVFALTTKLEYFLATILFGLMSGSEQSFSRSIYAEYIPSGHEAEYFSFYEISDKGTAWLGPLIVGIIFSSTGSIRTAYCSTIFFFVFGAFLFAFFNPDKAELERVAYEKKYPKI